MWNYLPKHALQKDITKHYTLEMKITRIERSKLFLTISDACWVFWGEGGYVGFFYSWFDHTTEILTIKIACV